MRDNYRRKLRRRRRREAAEIAARTPTQQEEEAGLTLYTGRGGDDVAGRSLPFELTDYAPPDPDIPDISPDTVAWQTSAKHLLLLMSEANRLTLTRIWLAQLGMQLRMVTSTAHSGFTGSC